MTNQADQGLCNNLKGQSTEDAWWVIGPEGPWFHHSRSDQLGVLTILGPVY